MANIPRGANELTAHMKKVTSLLITVIDFDDNLPISGVKVTFGAMINYTDNNGQVYWTNLTPGNYTITLEAEGYETLVL